MTNETLNDINKAKEFFKCTIKREHTEDWFDYEYEKFSGFISYMYFIDKIDSDEMEALRTWLCDEICQARHAR